MNKRRKIPAPKTASDLFFGLITAEHMRWYLGECRYENWTDKQIGEQLALSAGFVGMVLKGTRAPSQAFLDAAGFEKITLYRMKSMQTRASGTVTTLPSGIKHSSA